MSVNIVYSGTGGQWLGITRDELIPWYDDETEQFKRLIEGAVDSVMQVCVCGHHKKAHCRHVPKGLMCKQCRQCKGFRKKGKARG